MRLVEHLVRMADPCARVHIEPLPALRGEEPRLDPAVRGFGEPRHQSDAGPPASSSPLSACAAADLAPPTRVRSSRPGDRGPRSLLWLAGFVLGLPLGYALAASIAAVIT